MEFKQKEQRVDWFDGENDWQTNTPPFNRIGKTHFEHRTRTKTELHTVVTLFGILQQLFITERLVHVRIHGLRVTRGSGTHNTHRRCGDFLFGYNRNGIAVLRNRWGAHFNSVLLSPTQWTTNPGFNTSSAAIRTPPFPPRSLKQGTDTHINRRRR